MIKKYFFLLLFFFLINKLFCQSYELFLDSNIRIICTIEKFVPSEHTIDICDTGLGWKGICLIDNEPLYGTDLEMPMNYFRNMSLIINNIDIPLDTKYMYNVELQGRFSKDQFKLFKEEMGYYLYGLFSDAAGCYGACWQIINNKSFRTVITQDEWFWNMFEDLE